MNNRLHLILHIITQAAGQAAVIAFFPLDWKPYAQAALVLIGLYLAYMDEQGGKVQPVPPQP